MRLCDALGVQRGAMVAFTGAGGKTSALLRLGHELHADQWRVLATTTTRLGERELRAFPHAIRLSKIESPHHLSTLLNQHGFVFVYDRVWGGKVIGIPPDIISAWTDHIDSDTILVEADGSRRLPLKAPQAHEPVIPAESSLVVPVAGLDAVGQPFDAGTVYNPQPIVEKYGFVEGNVIQPAWIAQIVRDEELGLKNVPAQARVIPLLNKANHNMLDRIKNRRIAQMILHQPRVQAVAIGRVQRRKQPVFEVQRRVAAIILAGGLSSRMGRSKPLLPWGHQTVIEAIIKRLVPLRLSDIVVVTGHEAENVRAVVKAMGVKTVHNAEYATGEMLSSLQAGIKALDHTISACLVVLGDQPQLSPRLVTEILIAYAEGAGTIIAPSYNNRRGHPILIDRRYWSQLLDLPAGSAPRDVINAYPDEIGYVIAKDDSSLRDMDTPEEYRQELRRAGLL